MNTVTSKIEKTSEYLNTRKLVLVYGELCRQANKNPDINFSARFKIGSDLVKAGVKVKAFSRYTKNGVNVIVSTKQESWFIKDGWSKS